MSAIAGYICRGGDIAPDIACNAMLAALEPFGPHGADVRSTGQVAFGRCLHLVLPEDDHDRQPLSGGDGRFLLTADVRIDNRDELIAALGVSGGDPSCLSDADLLLRSWERWQLALLDRVLGDMAFAVWDAKEQRLTLCRGPLATKPLFYHQGSRFIAFASMPAGLLALPKVPNRPDLEEIAQMSAGGIHAAAPRSMFEGISAVPQGHAIIFSGSSVHDRRIWDLDRPLRSIVPTAEAGEALAAEMDRAVAARLRRRDGRVASQLSGGRDSSAVATTAARLLGGSGEALIALTGAPRSGFADGTDGHWLADESQLAAATARHQGYIEHHICRLSDNPFAERLALLHRLHPRPLSNMSNFPWWSEVNDKARDAGASVLLTGTAGNFSISVGGSEMLTDEMIENGPGGWWKQARRIGRGGAAAWRNIANVTLGPYFPPSLYRWLMLVAGRDVPGFSPLPLLREPMRRRAEEIRRERFSDWRPPKSYRALVRDTLYRIDNADKMSLAAWGLDQRDPTSDRRLVELCLSLPAGQLMSPNGGRPAFDAAFADRIPDKVLNNRRRGYQGADWFELFKPADVRAAFAQYMRHPLVRDFIDEQALSAMIDAWPTRDGWRIGTIDRYCNQLLGTLSLASFINANFPD